MGGLKGPCHSPHFKAFPGATWCPAPCPELLLRGWQMLFHRLRRVGGLRKVLLGGSGGQRGRQQLPPSQAWLSGLPSPSIPQAWLAGGAGGDGGRLFPLVSTPPTAHQVSWLRPPPILGCAGRAPREGGRRRSGLRTAGARAAKYLRELSETDRHVGNSVCAGLGEAAGWAGGRRRRAASLPTGPLETTSLHPSPPGASHPFPILRVSSDSGWPLRPQRPAEVRAPRGSGGLWSQAGIRLVPDWPPGNSSCPAPTRPSPAPALAQLVSWPVFGQGRLEEPGIAQPGQGTGRVEETECLSPEHLGVVTPSAVLC